MFSKLENIKSDVAAATEKRRSASKRKINQMQVELFIPRLAATWDGCILKILQRLHDALDIAFILPCLVAGQNQPTAFGDASINP